MLVARKRYGCHRDTLITIPPSLTTLLLFYHQTTTETPFDDNNVDDDGGHEIFHQALQGMHKHAKIAIAYASHF